MISRVWGEEREQTDRQTHRRIHRLAGVGGGDERRGAVSRVWMRRGGEEEGSMELIAYELHPGMKKSK